jgi:PAS domain S-box-containing protein
VADRTTASIGEGAAAERRPVGWGRRLVQLLTDPWTVFGLALLATAAGWHVARMAVIEENRARFDIQADRIATSIATRMATYEQVLVGGAAFFAAAADVTREDWAAYVRQLRIAEQFPGIQATGFAARVPANERARHVARMRREEGLAAYDIRPPGERLEYVPILYNEPYAGRNRAVIGLDMFAEPTRRAAMERARDTGLPTVSGKVVLAGETTQDRPPGFVLYVPVFAHGQPVGTPEARRQALIGHVFGPFRMHDLMGGVLGPQERDVHIKVFDGMTAEPEALLYDSVGWVQPPIAPWEPAFTSMRAITVAGRTWTLAFAAAPEFARALDRHVPLIVLGGGAAIALLLFAATRWLAEVRRSEQRFRDYAELGSDWFWEQDSQLRFTYLSPRYQAVTGTDPAEILGRTCQEVFGRPHRSLLTAEAWSQHLKMLAERRPFRDFEVPAFGPDGRIRYELASGVPVFDEAGRFAGYRGIGRDATEERRRESDLLDAMEEAEAANRSKSAFLAHMSHELRTPLNAVLGFSEIIRDQHFGRTGAAKYIEYAGDIFDSGSHLLALVNDVLDMSRIEAGRYELREEPADLRAIIDSSVAMLTPRADGRVQIRVRLDADLPRLYADLRAVKQVVLNLLGNAIKFTEQGGAVTVAAMLEPDGGLALMVADTGVGIPADHLDAVFQPFHQVDKLPRRRQSGSGLGLAISRSLVVLHGGTIRLDSELGRGTTATVHFPAARVLRA